MILSPKLYPRGTRGVIKTVHNIGYKHHFPISVGILRSIEPEKADSRQAQCSLSSAFPEIEPQFHRISAQVAAFSAPNSL